MEILRIHLKVFFLTVETKIQPIVEHVGFHGGTSSIPKAQTDGCGTLREFFYIKHLLLIIQ